MNPADRSHFDGRVRPMDNPPPAGSAPNCTPRAARNRIWTVIAINSFWLVMAVLCLIRLWKVLD
jgi:hypothetical protein